MTEERDTIAGLSERAHHADDDKLAAPRKRRMSAKRKQEAVLRVPRGEDLEVVKREIGTTAPDRDATVKAVHVQPGGQIDVKDLLVELE